MQASLALLSLLLVLAAACGDSAGTNTGPNAAGAGSANAGATSAGTSNGGTSSGGGAAAGGTPSAGSGTAAGQAGAGGIAGGAVSGGNGGGLNTAGGGGGDGSGCTRELLKGAVDAYFKALAAHSTSTLPLAENVKFTENGKASKPGEEGLWKTAGTLKYVHSALDTELCMSASEAVVPDGSTDVPVALRLKLQDQKITEIESIVARDGDYPALDADPAALVASNDQVKWEQPVPTEQRATREELIAWMKKYFERFPAGVCNTTPDCLRIENGGGNFVCGQGASCASGNGSGQAVLDPRLVFADVESGLGVGFTIFTGGYVDMHMFKMYGGKVYAVSAILANGNDSGWD